MNNQFRLGSLRCLKLNHGQCRALRRPLRPSHLQTTRRTLTMLRLNVDLPTLIARMLG